MILPVTGLFRAQAEAYRLRMHCEDCALFDEALQACAHGYPVQAHRADAPSADVEITFCKDFEAA